MYVLFEISNEYLIICGIICALLLVFSGVFITTFKKKNKVKPIDDDFRFEAEPKKVEFKNKAELTSEQQKAREELERVYDQMNADLEKQVERVVDDFERQQEENAIISYQELVRQVQGIKQEKSSEEKFTLPEIDIPEEEPISSIAKAQNYLESLEAVKPTLKTYEEIENSKLYSGSKTKFNNSEIISPIYGRQETKETMFDVEKTVQDLEEEDKEKQNAEFLQTLKEFRNNL